MIDGPYRGAVVLARTELLRTYRRLRNDSERALAALAGLLLFGVWAPTQVRERATAFGHELATGSVPVGTGGEILAGLVILGGYVGLVGGFEHSDGRDAEALVRTSLPPAVRSVGRLLLWTVVGLVVVSPPVTLLLWWVANGAGTFLAPALVLVATAPVLVAALVIGGLLGTVLHYAGRTLDVSLWTKVLGSLLVTTGAYLGFHVLLSSATGGADGSASTSIPALLPARPLQAFFGTVFAPFGGTITAVGVATAVGIVLAVPVGTVATLRIEGNLSTRGWGGVDDAVTVAVSNRRVPRPFTATPATRTAWRYLLRVRRDPRTIAHLSSFLCLGLVLVVPSVDDPGDLAGLLPVIAVVGGATLGGASFCLNPIGEERSRLPLLLTSTPSPSVVVRGRLIAAVLVGLIVAVGIGAPAGVLLGSPRYALIQTAVAVFLTFAGTGTALGLGATFPSFERQTVLSDDRVRPNQAVLFGFLFGGIVVGIVGLSLVEWTVGGASFESAAIVWAVYVATIGGIGWGGYVRAVGRFDALVMDLV